MILGINLQGIVCKLKFSGGLTQFPARQPPKLLGERLIISLLTKYFQNVFLTYDRISLTTPSHRPQLSQDSQTDITEQILGYLFCAEILDLDPVRK